VDSSPTRSVGQSFDPAARGVTRGSLLRACHLQES
jgi:hypothetical protein